MPTGPGRSRLLAIGAIAFTLLVVVWVLARGGEGYEVTAEFQNASQVVGGESVVIGGVPVGTVGDVSLGDDNQALIRFSVDEGHAPLPAGTTATVRTVSLAGIANRRIELHLPAGGGDAEIADGATIPSTQTESSVDFDAVLQTLDAETVAEFKRTVEGLAGAYRGVGSSGNRGLRYLNPYLSTSRRLIGELTRDEFRLRRLISDTDRFTGVLAERAPELSQLVSNVSLAAGAIGRQRAALTASIERLPDLLRLSNTTFVNLRAAADDLEPLLEATQPVAERLAPLLPDLRVVAANAVPTVRGLDALASTAGSGNDLVELLEAAVPLAEAGAGAGRPDCGDNPREDYDAAADEAFDQGALGEATCTLRNSLPVLAHFRAYTPELVGWFDDFGTSGAIDASGGIGRIAGTFNTFSANPVNGLPELLSPLDPTDVLGLGGANPLLDVGNLRRCPGANERDPGDGSTPFTDGGDLNCDPSQVATGP